MLNTPTATAVVQSLPGALNPPGGPGLAPNSGDDGQAFAQALDQAAARQRDAASDAAEPQPRGRSKPNADAARPDAGAALPAAAEAARVAAPHPTVAAMAAAGSAVAAAAAAVAAATAMGEGLAEAPEASLPPVSGSESETDPPNDLDATPPDLAAWVSSLQLPRPAPAALPAATAAPPNAGPALAAVQDTVAGATARRTGAQADLDPVADSTAPTSTPVFAAPALGAGGRQPEARHARGLPPALEAVAGKGREPMPSADAAAQAWAGLRETVPVARTGNDGGALVSALPLGAATAALRTADTGAVLQAELRAPVGSNEFAPALGSQLSVMVRDGIEQAQLKLNPADMGPIEVRISLDGTQAQVDFSAANAATRQALQEAVPALASALRESGLTLSGGGVFEQAREQRNDSRQDSAGPRRDSHGGAAEPLAGGLPAARPTRTRGVVDLYA